MDLIESLLSIIASIITIVAFIIDYLNKRDK